MMNSEAYRYTLYAYSAYINIVYSATLDSQLGIKLALIPEAQMLILFQLALRILGILNMLRGFFIFVVFIWKPSIWKMTTKQHPKLAQALTRPFHLIREKCFGFQPESRSGSDEEIELTDRRHTVVLQNKSLPQPMATQV